jgi:myo-inositol-1(or 4)-monophosphatase
LSRDVAAGFAILEEAGGLVTTANPPNDPETADITRAHLGGRLYLAIRYALVNRTLKVHLLTFNSPAGPSETETGRQTQERTVREVWKRVRELDYKRPGV